ncbi:MAG: choice-of-anchor L domain-containing protein [Bacteroidales bacterium]|nr:choice-of-anchor L domain-containing protein [Bacteroidales bacterium]
MLKKLQIFLLISLFATSIFGQELKVDKSKYTTEQLIKEVLITGSVIITNIKYTGSSSAIGYFYEGDPAVCFDNGIILATGDITNASGPNDSDYTKTEFNTAGDNDIQKLVPGHYTSDAAVLEFDFKPSSDTVRFEYIFASEEYPEYVNQGFNDVFAFFLTGKNPEGGMYTNLNIALVPGTEIPVTIDNVNSKKNKEFFTDNKDGINIEYDGLTKPLIAQAVVVPGETYHIKIAICDVGDSDYDSGVFLKATSFYGGSSLSYYNTCFGDETKFELTNSEFIEKVYWDFGDPDSGKDNNSTEKSPTHKYTKGGEFEVVVITTINGIEDTIVEKITINGRKVFLGDDVTIKEGENYTLDAGPGGVSYLWSNGETTQTITVNQPGNYLVEVTFADDCKAKDDINITVKDTCICCLLALIFGILMTIVSLILFLICRSKAKKIEN